MTEGWFLVYNDAMKGEVEVELDTSFEDEAMWEGNNKWLKIRKEVKSPNPRPRIIYRYPLI